MLQIDKDREIRKRWLIFTLIMSYVNVFIFGMLETQGIAMGIFARVVLSFFSSILLVIPFAWWMIHWPYTRRGCKFLMLGLIAEPLFFLFNFIKYVVPNVSSMSFIGFTICVILLSPFVYWYILNYKLWKINDRQKAISADYQNKLDNFSQIKDVQTLENQYASLMAEYKKLEEMTLEIYEDRKTLLDTTAVKTGN